MLNSIQQLSSFKITSYLIKLYYFFQLYKRILNTAMLTQDKVMNYWLNT